MSGVWCLKSSGPCPDDGVMIYVSSLVWKNVIDRGLHRHASLHPCSHRALTFDVFACVGVDVPLLIRHHS